MPSLLEVQSAMRARLLDDANPVAAALLAEALTTADRLSIYRNTSRLALTNTLRLNYPAVQRLVGEDFFAAAADIFITKDPPRMAWLDFYGAAFPEFLEPFKPAASLPYLPDVARLERAVSHALHAADAKALAPAELADLPQSAQGSVSFVRHPSVDLLSSNYPVDAIWRAVLARDDAALAAIDLDSGGVWLLVERTAGTVEVTRLDELLHLCGERLGIVPVDLRIGERAVPQRVEHQRGGLVFLAFASRLSGVEVVYIPNQ